MFIASVLKEVMSKLSDPEDVVRELNRRAMQLHFSDQLIQYYFTGIYMVIDMERGVAEYVNAGHPPGLLLRSGSGEVEQIVGGSPAIGLFDGISVNKQSLRITSGDRMVIVTDGLLEGSGDMAADPIELLGNKLSSSGLEDCSSFPEQWREALFGEPAEDRGRSDDQCLVWIGLK
jgi:sigma-B regulation protein RsbU (phosphoserine phosphatase)